VRADRLEAWAGIVAPVRPRRSQTLVVGKAESTEEKGFRKRIRPLIERKATSEDAGSWSSIALINPAGKRRRRHPSAFLSPQR
jgi:hypothetical protein